MKRLTVALLALPIQAAAQPAFGGGGAGGQSIREILNRIANFIISEVGLGICFLLLLITILVAASGSAFNGPGGARAFGMTCFWIILFVGVSTIFAVLTGGAQFGGTLFA